MCFNWYLEGFMSSRLFWANSVERSNSLQLIAFQKLIFKFSTERKDVEKKNCIWEEIFHHSITLDKVSCQSNIKTPVSFHSFDSFCYSISTPKIYTRLNTKLTKYCSQRWTSRSSLKGGEINCLILAVNTEKETESIFLPSVQCTFARAAEVNLKLLTYCHNVREESRGIPKCMILHWNQSIQISWNKYVCSFHGNIAVETG